CSWILYPWRRRGHGRFVLQTFASEPTLGKRFVVQTMEEVRMTTAHHDLEHLDRVRRVTAAYHEFQGLGMVIIGLGLGVFALTFTGRLEHAALGLLIMLALFAVTTRYYRRRFGEVRPRRTAAGRLGVY